METLIETVRLGLRKFCNENISDLAQGGGLKHQSPPWDPPLYLTLPFLLPRMIVQWGKSDRFCHRCRCHCRQHNYSLLDLNIKAPALLVNTTKPSISNNTGYIHYSMHSLMIRLSAQLIQ